MASLLGVCICITCNEGRLISEIERDTLCNAEKKKIEMPHTSILGENYWDRDGGTVELRFGKCQLSPVQLQLRVYIYALMGLITTWIHLLAVITHTRARSLIAPVCGDHRALCVINALIKWWVIDLPGID